MDKSKKTKIPPHTIRCLEKKRILEIIDKYPDGITGTKTIALVNDEIDKRKVKEYLQMLYTLEYIDMVHIAGQIGLSRDDVLLTITEEGKKYACIGRA